MGTGPFLGVERLLHGINHPPPSIYEVKEIVYLTATPPVWHYGKLQGEFYFMNIYFDI